MPLFPETRRVNALLPWYMGTAISSITHGIAAYAATTVSTATNWPTANMGQFVPVVVPEPVMLRQLGWFNGSVIGGSADAGIYSEDGTLIISTTPTAQSGTTAWQFVNITDTLVGPGLFYLAISLNSASARLAVFAVGSAERARLSGLAEQLSVATLPATATMVVTTRTVIPVIYAQVDTGA